MRKQLYFFTAILLSAITTYAQDGSLDTTFNHDGICYHTEVLHMNKHPSTIESMLVMPDSTILLGCQPDISYGAPDAGMGIVFCRLDKNGNVLDTLSATDGNTSYLVGGYKFLSHLIPGKTLAQTAVHAI